MTFKSFSCPLNGVRITLVNGAYNFENEGAEEGDPTKELYFSTKLNDNDRIPHEFSFDHLTTKGSESEDGLFGKGVRSQVGVTLKPEDSITLRGSRTTDTEYSIDVGEGRTEVIGSDKTHLAGELTLGLGENEGSGSFKGVAMREQTRIDGMRGIVDDNASAWNDTGKATEVGLTVTRGFNGNNTKCCVGVIHERGDGFIFAQSPSFSQTSRRGVTTERSCGVTFVDGDDGQSAEASFQISQQDNRGNSMYLRASSITLMIFFDHLTKKPNKP